MQDLEEKIVGLLLGLAAGDRIGGSVRMALRVAEILPNCSGLDVSDLGMRCLDWWREPWVDNVPPASPGQAFCCPPIATVGLTSRVSFDKQMTT